MKNAYKIFVGKPEWNRALGRLRGRWKDDIWTDAKEIGWEVVDWIHLARDRGQWRALVKTVMNRRVQLNMGIFLTSCMTVGFWRPLSPLPIFCNSDFPFFLQTVLFCVFNGFCKKKMFLIYVCV
jgi:hypothetical protein